MDEKKPMTLISTSEPSVRGDALNSTPRLTPTGKISHAKTRVYTQRYRKEWELMPDFKGWLTSVPLQPTRAYCLFCKKNLHAHRLSLLKHTCTMKHQRAALSYDAEHKTDPGKFESTNEHEVEEGYALEVSADYSADGSYLVETLDSTPVETEENEDEIEYVVERLEMDEDELNEAQAKLQENVAYEEQEEEYGETEEDVNLRIPSDDEDTKTPCRKIKIEATENCRDTLEDAIAQVHGEYLEDVQDQENIQMEIVAEPEDMGDNIEMQEEHQTSSEAVENNRKISKEGRESSRFSRRGIAKTDKKIGIKSEQHESKTQSDQGIVMACPFPILGTTYQLNTSVATTPGTIGVLQPVNTLPIAPAQNKTITLTSGGKTLTLTGGTFPPGTQYILSKVKGKLPTLVVADKKEMDTASSSTKKHDSTRFTSKKPRVSTHVVDISKGLPVGGLQVSLYKLMDGRWTFLNESNTGPNGRCGNLVDDQKITFTAGRYKIHFDVDKYFTLRRIETMYPFIEIVFDVKNPMGHYHIPLLLSPFGYSTYRGADR